MLPTGTVSRSSWTTRSARCCSARSSASCASPLQPSPPRDRQLMRHGLASLYGMTLHQSYRYFRMFPSDKLWLKIVVRFLPSRMFPCLPSGSDSAHVTLQVCATMCVCWAPIESATDRAHAHVPAVCWRRSIWSSAVMCGVYCTTQFREMRAHTDPPRGQLPLPCDELLQAHGALIW